MISSPVTRVHGDPRKASVASIVFHAGWAEIGRHSRLLQCFSDRLQLLASSLECRFVIESRIQGSWPDNADSRTAPPGVTGHHASQESLHLVQFEEFGTSKCASYPEHPNATLSFWTEPYSEHNYECHCPVTNRSALLPKTWLLCIRLHIQGMESADGRRFHTSNWSIHAWP